MTVRNNNITGVSEVVTKLLSLRDQTFRRVTEAIEKTAVRMAAHARAGHEHGSDPHSRSRYENQTNNLTNSISPGGPGGQAMAWEEISESRVIGLFGITETAPSSVLQYAPYIEERFPFIWPAAAAHAETFQKEVAAAANPDKKA